MNYQTFFIQEKSFCSSTKGSYLFKSCVFIYIFTPALFTSHGKCYDRFFFFLAFAAKSKLLLKILSLERVIICIKKIYSPLKNCHPNFPYHILSPENPPNIFPQRNYVSCNIIYYTSHYFCTNFLF